jgi:glucans biosynthesis protein
VPLPLSVAKSFGAIAMALLAARGTSMNVGAAGDAAAAPEKSPPGYAFSFDVLVAEAKRRAAAAYGPPHASLPPWLDKLSQDQYRSIRFDPDEDFWRDDGLPFHMELLPAGFNFQTPVTVSVVENGQAQDLTATPEMFEFGPTIARPPRQAAVPLSGFRIRSHINSKKIWDEFLVFQGASYFRAVAQHQVYGLSGRGLAIGTAEPAGEEFPAFTHFWIERPAAAANAIVIYALLESASTTGAYRFTVEPGVETSMDVDLTLFPRVDLRVLGIAPLTSMFLFDETNRGRLDDSRPEVHDSDGLQVAAESGKTANLHLHDAAAAGVWSDPALAATERLRRFGCAVRTPAQRLDRTAQRLGPGRRRTRGDSFGPRNQRQHRRFLATCAVAARRPRCPFRLSY